MKTYHHYIVFTFLFLLTAEILLAHSGKPKYHIVIDSDCSVDDMRAITMLLAANDLRVIGIVSSQGGLSPADGLIKINSLLEAYYHQGIPTAMGNNLNFTLPPWNKFSQEITWGPDKDLPLHPETSNVFLDRITNDYPGKITLVALGSLNTYAEWIKSNPSKINKIERIIWYSDNILSTSFNYLVDTLSYQYIVQQNIRLTIVSAHADKLPVTEEYLNCIENQESIYASQIVLIHRSNLVMREIKKRHLQFWDDLIPLYLLAPVLFNHQSTGTIDRVSLSASIPAKFVYETISTILSSAISSNNRVFKEFPVRPDLYKEEYVNQVLPAIRKFGLNEWKAITLTNEIHGHTGIYSIIGAKMGIRAMEYFNVGVNNLQAVSFAGYIPPYSCLNDGIQVSTGCTIGQGLIQVSDTVIKEPVAIFEFNKQRIRISLKKEIAEKMEKEIKYGVDNFGMSDNYWAYIEKLALEYWIGMSRYEIFDIKAI